MHSLQRQPLPGYLNKKLEPLNHAIQKLENMLYEMSLVAVRV
jgi:hypothetical protein